jgi:hypothetical protein
VVAAPDWNADVATKIPAGHAVQYQSAGEFADLVDLDGVLGRVALDLDTDQLAAAIHDAALGKYPDSNCANPYGTRSN